MPRPRTPDNVLQLNGSGKHNAGRLAARKNQPRDKRPVGPCPAYLTDPEKKAWRDLVRDAIPGVLFRSDRVAMESGAKLVAKMRDQAVSDDARRTAMVRKIDECDFTDPLSVQGVFYDLMSYTTGVTKYNSSDQSNLRALLGQFGMLPADRSKIICDDGGKSDNPFADD